MALQLHLHMYQYMYEFQSRGRFPENNHDSQVTSVIGDQFWLNRSKVTKHNIIDNQLKFESCPGLKLQYVFELAYNRIINDDV